VALDGGLFDAQIGWLDGRACSRVDGLGACGLLI
jgi:hypothetical protein